LKENRMWLGYGFKGGAAHFINRHYEDYAAAGDHKEGMIRVSGVVWFTNLNIKKRHEDLILYRTYDEESYPKYDNYDAINVDKTKDIPCDYYEVMGVPITFLDKYNPDQFEVVGITTNDKNNLWGVKIRTYTPNDAKNYSILNAASVLLKDGKLKAMYARVLIRRKQGEAQ
ncbi:MAG: modification methylase, partial [Verrucomicrobiae bacterium]|nr:modification methylase [Verrucomicrobiae bacterium]